MIDFHKVNGWQYQCVGGPEDQVYYRMSAAEKLEPDQLPIERWGFSKIPDGHYKLEAVLGKTAKYKGKLYPKYHYVWVDEPIPSKDEWELAA